MRHVLAVVLLLLTTSCAINGHAVAQKAKLAGGHIDQAVTSAQQSIVSALPHTDNVGKAYLADATADLKTASAQLPALEQAANELETVQTKLDTVNKTWLSPMQQKQLVVLSLGTVVAVLGLVTLFGLSGMAGPVGTVAGLLVHTVTLGTLMIGGGLKNFFASFHAKVSATT